MVRVRINQALSGSELARGGVLRPKVHELKLSENTFLCGDVSGRVASSQRLSADRRHDIGQHYLQDFDRSYTSRDWVEELVTGELDLDHIIVPVICSGD